MSQLFDNYKHRKQCIIPDNHNEFLKMPREKDDVIVLGADGTHCQRIPHPFSEIAKIEITYWQGIEEKLVYTWPNILGGHNLDIDYDMSTEFTTYVVYDILASEADCFNWYNKDVRFQIKVWLEDGHQDCSRVFKAKIVKDIDG